MTGRRAKHGTWRLLRRRRQRWKRAHDDRKLQASNDEGDLCPICLDVNIKVHWSNSTMDSCCGKVISKGEVEAVNWYRKAA